MMQSWFPNDMTFNGPAWSLSVEMLLYISFFVVCSVRLTRPAFIACLCISGFFVWKFDQQIGRGLLSFYLGCLSAILVGQIQETRKVSVEVLLSIATVLTAALLAFIASKNLGALEILMRVVIFPALVILLALFDESIEGLTGQLRWLGDISYSSYLLHFPLQLAVVTTGVAINYSSPVTLLCFFVVLVAAALASFHWFEKPVMNAMRSRIPLAIAFRKGLNACSYVMRAGMKRWPRH
jgi:peptidoglycan/LPS O-acetylase OafA/YrhL